MEPPSFHIKNLYSNKIKWKHKKIEDLIYKLQEEKYPNYNVFAKYINNIYIFWGDTENE